ncbi:MAG: MBL fold metallo-hydrolase, partial [Oscillospiraceae bacterium]|nr:MBL fold metallo-hydrolase [Oscillospiraceae bacterium]
YARTGGTSVLIDAGVSARRIAASLAEIGESPGGISALILSHRHSDHIGGAYVLAARNGIPVYANAATWAELGGMGRFPDGCAHAFETGSAFTIGGFTVRSFRLPHDAGDTAGFCLSAGGAKVSVATDFGHVTESMVRCMEDSGLIYIESNHDVDMLKAGRYPYYLKKRILSEKGHISNEGSGEVCAYLAGKGARSIILGHLSKENNAPELAYATVRRHLEGAGLEVGRDVALSVAPDASRSALVEV